MANKTRNGEVFLTILGNINIVLYLLEALTPDKLEYPEKCSWVDLRTTALNTLIDAYEAIEELKDFTDGYEYQENRETNG